MILLIIGILIGWLACSIYKRDRKQPKSLDMYFREIGEKDETVVR